MSWNKLRPAELKVDYTNLMMPSSRHTGSSRLVTEEGKASYEPDSQQLKGIIIFSSVFIPLFSISAYLFIPGQTKWLFVAAGPTIGTFTFAAIYFLIKQEIDAGPYIQFIEKTSEITLPRIGKRFNKSNVTLQWITGKTKHSSDIVTDLNLIVEENDSKNRYYVMTSPIRKYVKQFSEHSGISVVEINMGWTGRRDIDIKSSI